MNPEALRRIEAVRQFRSTALDLRGFKLEAVPDALSDLVQLEELNLDNNFLTDLPAWFTRLNQLKNLWIGNNRLVAMPIVLQSLPNVLSLAPYLPRSIPDEKT